MRRFGIYFLVFLFVSCESPMMQNKVTKTDASDSIVAFRDIKLENPLVPYGSVWTTKTEENKKTNLEFHNFEFRDNDTLFDDYELPYGYMDWDSVSIANSYYNYHYRWLPNNRIFIAEDYAKPQYTYPRQFIFEYQIHNDTMELIGYESDQFTENIQAQSILHEDGANLDLILRSAVFVRIK